MTNGKTTSKSSTGRVKAVRHPTSNTTVIRRPAPPDERDSTTSARRPEARWAAIDALADKDIARAVGNDRDAAPIADTAFWKRATLIERTPKQAIGIRLDKDVVDWFKAQGRGYQGRMNAVLKTYMVAHKGDG